MPIMERTLLPPLDTGVYANAVNPDLGQPALVYVWHRILNLTR